MPIDPLPNPRAPRPPDAGRLGEGVRRFAHGSRVPGWDDGADLAKPPAEVPDPATVSVPAGLRAEIEAHVAKYPTARSATIPALLAAQRVHGWCSPLAISQAACVLRLTPAELAAVAGFYDMLETRPKGARHVYVCTNISCSLRGGDELLARLQEELAGADDVNLRAFECLGACDLAPMCSVEGTYVGPIADEEVAVLAGQIRRGEDPLPERQLARRLVADPEANTRDWRAEVASDARVATAVTDARDPRDRHLSRPGDDVPERHAGPPSPGAAAPPPAAADHAADDATDSDPEGPA